MTIEPSRLSIHVLGAGKGESIVLQLPNGHWGVVDCYARSSTDPAKNQTLQFLLDQDVKELEFLCLTHPHDDHYKGMSQLLEKFKVHYFWNFNGLSGNHFSKLAEYLQTEAEQIDRQYDLESATEFTKIFGLIRRMQKSQQPPLRQKVAGIDTTLFPVPSNSEDTFRIIGLAPSGNQVQRYQDLFLRCFDDNGNLRYPLPQSSHNVISTALLIVFGRTRIVLGGDVECAGWKDVLEEMGSDHLAVSAVKISHHGSTNGYCDGLWDAFSARGKPLGVVTAYVSQNLPARAALEHIAPRVETILTTCLTALNENQLPTTADISVFRSLIALSGKTGRLPTQARHEFGRCTLIFDDEGRCLEQEFVSPAGRIF